MRAVAGRRTRVEPVKKTFGDDAAERRLRGVLNAAWPVLDAHASSDLALEMIRARNTEGLIRGMPWERFIIALGDAAEPMAGQIGRAVQDAARDVGPGVARLRFQNEDIVAVKFAQQQSGKMIAAITESQRDAIRTVMASALRGQYTVTQAAAQLRDTIGLHPAWAEAVVKYQNRQYTRMVKEGMPPVRAMTRSEALGLRYRNRLVKRRSETIARTEIQTASNLGKYATWAQMIGSGQMRQDSTKEWSPGPGACPLCASLSGQTVPWNSPFSGGLMMPPAHPNCRCTAQLIPAYYPNPRLNATPIDWLNPLSGTSHLADTVFPDANDMGGDIFGILDEGI